MPQNDLKIQEFQCQKLVPMITNEEIAVALDTFDSNYVCFDFKLMLYIFNH